jgi:Bacterial CdiA-CT RNAse A domain
VQRTTDAFSEWLAPSGSGTLRFAADLDDIAALNDERDALWTRLEKTSFLTNDEKRAAIGYSPNGEAEPSGQKFNPGQLRKPSGSGRESGRWTKPGGDGGSATPGDGGSNGGAEPQDVTSDPGDGTGGSDDIVETSPAIGGAADRPQLIAGRKGYNVDIFEEDQRGGHTYERHVGKSDAYLINRVQTEVYRVGPVTIGLERAGSFPSLDAANSLTNSTLSQNTDVVEEVAAGRRGGARIVGGFSSTTGHEAYKSSDKAQPYIRETYYVETLIQHDRRSPRGFTVLTSYPRNAR